MNQPIYRYDLGCRFRVGVGSAHGQANVAGSLGTTWLKGILGTDERRDDPVHWDSRD